MVPDIVEKKSAPTGASPEPSHSGADDQPTAEKSGEIETTTATPSPATRTPPILCLGMARTGTASLVAALRALGVENVSHGLEVNGPEHDELWQGLGRAADACFPVLPSYRGTPFSREEWDEVFGSYGAVSDLASFFGIHLVRAYPEARVILVERDIDRWYTSIGQVFKPWQSRRYVWLLKWVEPLTGTRHGMISGKFMKGWTESTRYRDIYPNARKAYTRHYREIRESVPPEQLLDFQLSEGWEPLCRFLGKEVPAGPFPHVNDAAAYAEHTKQVEKAAYQRLFRRLKPPCF